MTDVYATGDGLVITREQDGGNGHYLILMDKQPVGTLRKVEGGWRAGGYDALFAEFGEAVVFVATSTARRYQERADAVIAGLVKAVLRGPIVEPKP